MLHLIVFLHFHLLPRILSGRDYDGRRKMMKEEQSERVLEKLDVLFYQTSSEETSDTAGSSVFGLLMPQS